jgi:hypothetical protein
MANIEVWSSTVNYSTNAFAIGSNGNWYVSQIPNNIGNNPTTPPSTGQYPWIPLGIQYGIPLYNEFTYFALNGYVRFNGKCYKSLVANNIGNNPGTSPLNWQLLAIQPSENDLVMPNFAQTAISKTDGGSPPKPSIAQFGQMAKNDPSNVYYTGDPQTIVCGESWSQGGWNDATIDTNGNRLAVLEQDLQAEGVAPVTAINNVTNTGNLPYNPTRTYPKGAQCTDGEGQIYVSLKDGNLNNTPSSSGSTEDWQHGLTDVGDINTAIVPTGLGATSVISAANQNLQGGAVNTQAISTGLVNPQNENVTMTYNLVAKTVTVSAVNQLIFLKTPPPTATYYQVIISVPTKTFTLSTATLPTPPNPNCTQFYFLCYNSSGNFVAITDPYAGSQDLAVLGMLAVLWTAGVPSFQNVTTPAFIRPSVSQQPWNQQGSFNQISNLSFFPNPAGNLSFSMGNGSLATEGINFAVSKLPAEVSVAFLSAITTVTFRYVSPAILNSTTWYPTTTSINPGQYWNGTALATVTPTNATIQRLFVLSGFPATVPVIYVQYGEQLYTSLANAVSALDTAPFTDLVNKSVWTLAGKVAVVGNATNLTNPSQAVWRAVNNSNAGGSLVPDHNSLSGLQGGDVNNRWHVLQVPINTMGSTLCKLSPTATEWGALPNEGLNPGGTGSTSYSVHNTNLCPGFYNLFSNYISPSSEAVGLPANSELSGTLTVYQQTLNRVWRLYCYTNNVWFTKSMVNGVWGDWVVSEKITVVHEVSPITLNLITTSGQEQVIGDWKTFAPPNAIEPIFFIRIYGQGSNNLVVKNGSDNVLFLVGTTIETNVSLDTSLPISGTWLGTGALFLFLQGWKVLANW